MKTAVTYDIFYQMFTLFASDYQAILDPGIVQRRRAADR